MLIEGRHNITPVAKEFKAKGVTGLPTFEHPSYSYQSPEALGIWYKMKPELYALTAVLIDRVVDRAIRTKHERPPFGLMRGNIRAVVDLSILPKSVESVAEITNDQDLISAMRTTLSRSVREEHQSLDNADDQADEERNTQLLFIIV